MTLAPGIDLLAARFAGRDLSPAEWTHEAHLLVGLWHVHRFGAVDAYPRVRDGILALNQRHGTPNTPTRGYHDTITRAYVALLAEFDASMPSEVGLDERADRLLRSPVAVRDALLACYSKGHLMSVTARAGWVEPDRRPLSLSALEQARAEHGGPAEADTPPGA